MRSAHKVLSKRWNIKNLDVFLSQHGLIVLFFLTTAIWMYVFQDYVFFKRAFVFDKFAIDSLSQFYPIEFFKLTHLLAGEFPLWSFQLDLGADVYSLMATINPFDVVLLLFGTEHFSEALPFVVFLKFLSAAIFFYAFLRKVSIDPLIAVTGSLLYTFSGYMVINCHWYHYTNYAVFVALTLYCFEVWFQTGRWIWLVLVLGLVSLKSELQLVHMVVFGSVYVLFRSVNSLGWTWRLLRIYTVIGFLFLFGVLIDGYVLFPDTVAVLSSSRAENAIQDVSAIDKFLSVFSFVDLESLKVIVARFFSNDILHSWIRYNGVANYFEDSSLYVGVVSVVCFPLSLVIGNRRLRLVWIFPSVLLILCCFPFFKFALNGFASGTFKYLSLYCSLFALFSCLLVLNAMLSSELEEDSQRRVTRTAKFLVTIFLFVTLLFIINYILYPTEGDLNSIILLAVFIFIFFYIFLLSSYQYTSQQVFKWLLLLLVVVELCIFSRLTIIANPSTVSPYFAARGESYFNPQTSKAIHYVRNLDNSFYRIEKGYIDGSLNDSLIQGYNGTQAYLGFASCCVIDFYRKMELSKHSLRLSSYRYGLEKRWALQSLLGVKYFLCRNDKECERLQGFKLIDTVDGVRIYQNMNNIPFGSMFYKQILSSGFDSLPVEDKDAVLLQAVITDTSLPRVRTVALDQIKHLPSLARKQGGEDPDVLQVTTWDHEFFKGYISTKEPGVLFFPIPFNDGWHVKVNGNKEKLYRLDLGFMGVPLPSPGYHEVELSYTPALMYKSLFISLCSLLLIVLVWVKKPIIRPFPEQNRN